MNNQSTYEVESDIPLPLVGRRNNSYPFASMKVGESFALKNSDIKEIERVRAAASYWGLRHPPQKFAVRIADPSTRSYRCWRVA